MLTYQQQLLATEYRYSTIRPRKLKGDPNLIHNDTYPKLIAIYILYYYAVYKLKGKERTNSRCERGVEDEEPIVTVYMCKRLGSESRHDVCISLCADVHLTLFMFMVHVHGSCACAELCVRKIVK